MLSERTRANGPGPGHTRVIHHGKVITVVEDTVTFPDGSSGTLDVVRHPGASAVLPFVGDPNTPDPSILLIRQFRHAANGWLLEIPAGRLHAGETPDTCALRELREETGYRAGQLTHLTSILTTPGFSDEVIHLFMATQLERGPTQRDADEFIEPAEFPLSAVRELIRTGEMRDAKSIIAVLLALTFRGRG